MELLNMKRDDFLILDKMKVRTDAGLASIRIFSATVLFSLGAALGLMLSAPAGAIDEPLPIRKLSVNENHDLLVEYAPSKGKFPTKPIVQDFPGTNHRLVLDFPDAVIDRPAMPPAKTALDELTKIFPEVRGLRYAALTGGTTPTARIVLDLPESLQIHPQIVTLGESSVSISLGFTPATATTNPAPTTETAPSSQPGPTTGTRIQPSESPSEPAPATATVAASSAPAAANPPGTPPPPSEPPVDRSKINFPEFAKGSPLPAAPVTTASSPESTPTSAGSQPVTEKSALSVATGEGTIGSAPLPTADESAQKPPAAIVPGQQGTPVAEASEKTAPAAASALDTEKQEPAPVAGQAAKSSTSELTQNNETLESRIPSHDAEAPKPDSESQATMAASGGKGYDPNAAREAAAAQADKMAADGSAASGADASNTVASAALPGATQATVQDSAASQKAAALRAEAERHFKAAVKFHMAEEFPAAIAEYKATIAVNPNLAEPYCNLGLIYNQQHNYDAALTEFHKALAVNPKDAITYNGVGAALRAEKDLVGAMKNWQTAVSLDPKLATALYNLGTAYEMQKDFDKALEAYRQAVAQDGRLGEAYYRMGLILQRRNNPSQAIEEFNKALKASMKAEYSEDARRRIASLSGKGIK
jgi:tetratricopeptide (TPR) repeat protein